MCRICSRCGRRSLTNPCSRCDLWLKTHHRRTSRSGRQTCCKVCHSCGSQLREVLDGELWCDTCQMYQ
jgi:hypothetical protein